MGLLERAPFQSAFLSLKTPKFDVHFRWHLWAWRLQQFLFMYGCGAWFSNDMNVCVRSRQFTDHKVVLCHLTLLPVIYEFNPLYCRPFYVVLQVSYIQPLYQKKQIQDQSNSMSHMPMSLFHCSLHLGEQEKKWIHVNEGQGWQLYSMIPLMRSR